MSADQLFTTSDPMDAPNHVKPEDGYRCDVCGLGAEQCNGVPVEVVERMREFIHAYDGVVGWQFAKTMADIPHSYAVREKAASMGISVFAPGQPMVERTGEDEFVWFALVIRQYGYKRRWSGKTLQYVNVDGWRYWTMGNPIDPTPGSKKTTILNRAPLTREGREQLRRENGLRNVRWFECVLARHRFGLVIETFDFEKDVVACPACGHAVDYELVDGP